MLCLRLKLIHHVFRLNRLTHFLPVVETSKVFVSLDRIQRQFTDARYRILSAIAVDLFGLLTLMLCLFYLKLVLLYLAETIFKLWAAYKLDFNRTSTNILAIKMGSYKASVAYGLKLDEIRIAFLLVLDQLAVEVWKLSLEQRSWLKIRSQNLVMNFFTSSL